MNRLSLLIPLALSLVPACRKPVAEPPAAEARPGVAVREDQMRYVEVKEAERDALGATFHATGRVAYDEDHVARLAVPVSGRVMKLNARPGDLVKPSQTLAVIHSADVAAAEAALAGDRAQRIQAEQALKRAERLVESGSGAPREVEEARTNLAQAKAAEDKDVAMLRVLGGGMSQPNPVFQLRSPIAGTVTERHATLGGAARVEDTNPLFVIADLGHLWVLVDVYEQDLALVKRGATAEVTVPAYPDRVFKGEVAIVGDTVDPASRTVKVRIAMANDDGSLKPEMFARVTLHATGVAAARVPASSILTKADHTYVFVEDKDEARHFLPREVTLGARQEASIQVLRGVTPGDRVVARGGLLLDAEMKQRL